MLKELRLLSTIRKHNGLPLRQRAAHRIQRLLPLPGALPGMREADRLARGLACGGGGMGEEMKITCTQKEFGELVRNCETISCPHCPLRTVCGDDMIEEAVKFEIIEENAHA